MTLNDCSRCLKDMCSLLASRQHRALLPAWSQPGCVPTKASFDLQAHPGIIAASIPWLGGHDYKRLCTWFPYMGVILVLTRDKGSGRVTIGRDGLPRMHYWPNKHDQQSMMNVRALSSALC